jgi:hypothetical protein
VWGNLDYEVGVEGCGDPVQERDGGYDTAGFETGFEIVPGPVIAHCGARIGMPAGDLHVSQVCSGVEHGRHERVPEHVRVRPAGPHSRGSGQAAQAAGGGVSVHPGSAAVERDRPGGPAVYRAVDGKSDGGRQGHGTTLRPLPHTRKYAVPVLLAEVGDVRARGLEDL